MTDTQVMQILEARRVDLSELRGRLPEIPEVSLLRPDDTHTRRALKEAVVQGAPISFALQLCRSDDPIELRSVPSLDIFRAYTLYLAEGAHQGRTWHALRLGFFSDAVSAKQVAHYAQGRFASVAVIPINETERTHASREPITLTLLAKPTPSAGARPSPKSENRSAATPKKERRKDGLEETLELLAADELWKNTDSDSLSDTGVRHLKVEVLKRKSRG